MSMHTKLDKISQSTLKLCKPTILMAHYACKHKDNLSERIFLSYVDGKLLIQGQNVDRLHNIELTARYTSYCSLIFYTLELAMFTSFIGAVAKFSVTCP